MARILYGTDWISEDEPCLGLFEMNEQAPDYSGFRRYQIIYVVRHDRIAEFRIDLGAEKAFRRDQFNIPGGVINTKTGKMDILHTVGELREIAEWIREKPAMDIRELCRVG